MPSMWSWSCDDPSECLLMGPATSHDLIKTRHEVTLRLHVVLGRALQIEPETKKLFEHLHQMQATIKINESTYWILGTGISWRQAFLGAWPDSIYSVHPARKATVCCCYFVVCSTNPRWVQPLTAGRKMIFPSANSLQTRIQRGPSSHVMRC